jgi:hypothetical protein
MPYKSNLQIRALLYFLIQDLRFRLVRQALSCVPALRHAQNKKYFDSDANLLDTFHTESVFPILSPLLQVNLTDKCLYIFTLNEVAINC